MSLTMREFAPYVKESDLQRGCIVAVVDLVNCLPAVGRLRLPGVFDYYPTLDTPRERNFGDYGDGRYGWVTEKLFRLTDPIPFKARQGLFDLPAEIEQEINRQKESAK